jgi:ketosteroid isomerase-like protein
VSSPSTSLDEVSAATLDTIRRFNEATNRHDVDAMMALMSDDVVFENTMPPPDGERIEGQVAMRAFWERLFRSGPNARFEWEEEIALGDRCVVRWRYQWADDRPEKPGHVRGVDLFRVQDGRISEKHSYVKG